MDKRIINLWADIGLKDYWDDLKVQKNGRKVPFEEVYISIAINNRWPQPGFIGKRYLKLPKHKRIAVIGQNPGVPNNAPDKADDKVMFKLIRNHSKEKSSESLDALFLMMREFMLGARDGRRAWGPIEDVQEYIGLNLDDIAYLNLIPLSTQKSNFELKTLKEPYTISTRRQIRLLKPAKILFFGKTPHEKFKEWDRKWWKDRKSDVKYVERAMNARIRTDRKIDLKRISDVKEWLNS